jgi:hypothetical protein
MEMEERVEMEAWLEMENWLEMNEREKIEERGSWRIRRRWRRDCITKHTMVQNSKIEAKKIHHAFEMNIEMRKKQGLGRK